MISVRILALFALILMFQSVLGQKRMFKERIVATLGVGASDLKSSFGSHPDIWIIRPQYRLGLGYAISNRITVGINWDIISLHSSNGFYLPGPSGTVVTVKKQTKVERYWLMGLHARVIPFAGFNRLSLSGTYGLYGYEILPDKEFDGGGKCYQLTIGVNVLKPGNLRLEPFVTYSNGSLRKKTIDGAEITGRRFEEVCIGVQLVMAR